VVRRRTVRGALTPTFDWFALRGDGSPLPAGTYVARVSVYDAVGNRQRFDQPVSVSHQDLVEEVWTESVPASQADTYPPFYGGCNDCAHCRPVDSLRFPDGLSFPACDIEYADTVGFFASDVPFPVAPVDSFRITATGGPTEPGSPDTGGLSGTPTGPGDSSTSTPWLPVSLARYPYLPDRRRPVTWTFGTRDDDSYDVAGFDIEYRHFVPAS
jgi:hypothetical protein